MRLYRLLLKLYPARFREEYARPLEQQFRDEYRELGSRAARARFWMRALADLAVSIPVELAGELRQDLRYGARIYRRRVFSTTLALAALSLAIGAGTGVFSVINALLLRSLPFREPEQLVELWLGGVNSFAGRERFNEYRRSTPYLTDAATFFTSPMSMARDEGAALVRVTETTANFFELFGVPLRLGRAFAAGEDIAGANNVAVISYGLWQQAFGGDARVLGSQLRISGVNLTLVGIAPPGFDYPSKTALWTPTVYEIAKLPKAAAFGSEVFGRLKPGLELSQARAAFEAEIRQKHPERLEAEGMNRPQLRSLRDQLAGPVRNASFVLLGAVGLVLLVACANVAQLLLSRLSERREELAVRAALGASRARLTQQLVTEAVLLTTGAALAGLLVARWAAQLAAAAQPAALESQSYAVLDWPVVGFALALAIATGLVFGVLPGLVTGRTQLAREIGHGRRGFPGGATSRLRFALIVMQAAMTVVLTGGSITLLRSFQTLMQTSVWYRSPGLATVTVSLAGSSYEQRRAQREYYDEALRRLRAVPGIESVAAVNYIPTFDGMFSGAKFRAESGQETGVVTFNSATDDYFRTMGIDLIAGRMPALADAKSPEREVVVSESVAGHEILGQTLVNSYTKSRMRVVGLVRGSQPLMYLGWFGPGFATLIARVDGDAAAYLPVMRDLVRDINRDIPVYDVKTMEERVDEGFMKQRFYTTATTFLAGFALLMAAVGVYGAAAYAVSQRTKEIGVRIAVGAPARQVRRLLARACLLPMTLGLVAGVAIAVLLGGSLQSLFFSAAPIGLAGSAGAAVILMIAGGTAVWRATARVVRMDPMRALRSE